jgi:[1-hydroxy-2-(trimethylamino)ethyl]phosphonate dioxygenase
MSTDTMTLDASNLGRILERRGGDSYLGEDVTMLEHMLQAATLAEAENADDELVAAALLHDIGHYTGEFPEELALEVNNHHDEGGAAVLAPFFPARMVDCVRNHVAAKLYLCAVDSAYLDKLSPASVRTMELQGGPMSPMQVAAFESNSAFADAVRVRQWDDQAKVADQKTPDFRHFKPMLQRLAERGPGGRPR